MTDSESNPATSDEEVQIVELSRQPIDLYKILKFEGLVGSGGEAKAAIAEGLVTLNGEIETQKRKKIVSGDAIEFAGIVYRMHCDVAMSPAKPTEDPPKAKADIAGSAAADTARPPRKKPQPKKAGRKAIGIKK